MLAYLPRPVLSLMVLVTVGCGGPLLRPQRLAPVEGVPAGGSAVIIPESEFAVLSHNVLTILRMHVRGMQVRYVARCPELALRGRRSIAGSNDPIIYVDGARTSDTCVLEQLSPVDVQRVEVYPMGVTSRPGYRPSPNGLILIFLRRGEEQQEETEGTEARRT